MLICYRLQAKKKDKLTSIAQENITCTLASYTKTQLPLYRNNNKMQRPLSWHPNYPTNMKHVTGTVGSSQTLLIRDQTTAPKLQASAAPI